MKFKNYLQFIIIFLLASMCVLLYVKVDSEERFKIETLEKIINKQKEINDSLFKVLSETANIKAVEVNNYYTTKYEKERDSIFELAIDEHILLFSKWYLSKKDTTGKRHLDSNYSKNVENY